MSENDLNPFFIPRKRAPFTGTAFDFIRVEVPCSKCGKRSKQPLAELIVTDATDCSYCGSVIDIHSEGHQAELLRLAEIYKEIK